MQEWIEQNANWSHIIENSAISGGQVKYRFKFNWQSFMVQASPYDETLNVATSGLKETLYEDIASTAATLWKQSLLGKTKVTKKALRPIKAIVEKLETLEFLDGQHIKRITNLLAILLAEVKYHTPITGHKLAILQNITQMLSEPKTLLEETAKHPDGNVWFDDMHNTIVNNMQDRQGTVKSDMDSKADCTADDVTVEDMAKPDNTSAQSSWFI